MSIELNYKLVVNGNFVFRTQNLYHSMWHNNPGVTLNINAGIPGRARQSAMIPEAKQSCEKATADKLESG